jgi:ribonucleoside-diphosphate reductase alpha chain
MAGPSDKPRGVPSTSNAKSSDPFSDTALAILSERYFRHDSEGRCVEDATVMFRRVAECVARPARDFGEDSAVWAARFFAHMSRLEFLPNSPTLMNAGMEHGQLAACFVLPIEDDLESIFAALRLTARIHQSGGGTGFSFSRLRPRGDRVRSTGGIASGPVSFIELFDHTTSVIRRGGRRRGANMGVLRIDHPDVLEFVDAKRLPGRLENFNLSVGITDEFLAALDTGARFALHNPRTGAISNTIDARTLFDAIAHAAWTTGDPGLLFLDQINRNNPTPALGRIEATNPCGEQPLLSYESCTLGSLNLHAFLSERGDIDWIRLRETIRDAVVFLDNVIEVNDYPAPEIAAATRRTRKIGLGVMGFADLLAALGIAYQSDRGIATGAQIAQFIARHARQMSAELGARRGSFPAFTQSIWPQLGSSAMRNAAVSCVAPTGTISVIAGVSSGIEPFFSLATRRRALDGHEFLETNRAVERELSNLSVAGIAAVRTIAETGSLKNAAGVPETLKQRFPIAIEIDPMAHLRMQAAFQSHVDAAVSKTVNLPADASVETVRDIFIAAARLGLKGITIYRYGSRPGQVLSLGAGTDDCRECAA